MRPIIKIHGGCFYKKDFIIKEFPKNYTELNYIEPYIGGGSIIFNKKSSVTEIVNDLNPGISAIFSCLKEDYLFHKFKNLLYHIDYSETSFKEAMNYKPKTYELVGLAIKEFILRRMSRGGLKKNFAWSERLRNGLPGDENAWNSLYLQLDNYHNRAKNLIVYNDNALNIIPKESGWLIFCDPPFVQNTRVSKFAYSDFEVDEEHHENLAFLLNKTESKCIIIGYDCDLYRRLYKNFDRQERELTNHSSQKNKKGKVRECLWKNY